MRQRLLIAVTIGLVSAAVCYARLTAQDIAAADFTWAWRGARLLIAGQNPYTDPALSRANSYPYDAPLYYPLPAVLLALPFAPLPPELAGAAFIGISAGLLAIGLTRDGYWRLTVFLSAPFWVALISA